jgi:hypothetical protein
VKMDSFLKLKSEFDNLVSKIKIPGADVSEFFLTDLLAFNGSRQAQRWKN